MINQKFIEENVNNLIELRSADEIIDFAKKNDLTLRLEDLHDMKNAIEQSMKLVDNENSILSLDSLSSVAGGDKSDDISTAAKIVSCLGTIGSALLVFTPFGIGGAFIASSLVSIVSEGMNASAQGIKTTKQEVAQLNESVAYSQQNNTSG